MTLYSVLSFLLTVFWLLLLARVVVEMVRSFARDWRPTGIVVVILEAIFTITDPPVKLLRRLIPPVSLGRIRLDLSIMVLFLIVSFLLSFVQRLAQSSGAV